MLRSSGQPRNVGNGVRAKASAPHPWAGTGLGAGAGGADPRECGARGIGSTVSAPIAGNAFEVDLGSGYDVVSLPNFPAHHFNKKQDRVCFLKKVHAALREGGTAAIVESAPNPDRASAA